MSSSFVHLFQTITISNFHWFLWIIFTKSSSSPQQATFHFTFATISVCDFPDFFFRVINNIPPNMEHAPFSKAILSQFGLSNTNSKCFQLPTLLNINLKSALAHIGRTMQLLFLHHSNMDIYNQIGPPSKSNTMNPLQAINKMIQSADLPTQTGAKQV